MGRLSVVMYVLFSILQKNFCTWGNLMTICCSACVIAIIGIGITFIMATGELDFSAGTQCAASTVIMGLLLQTTWFHSYVGAIVVTILSMALFGCLNAFLHVKLGIPAFIATFGSSYMLQGLFRIITKNQGYYNLQAWPDCFTYLGQGYLFGVVPVLVIVLLILGIVATIYNEKTKWGRYLYALGANAAACNYLGINAKMQKLRGFILCSVFCAIAGIVQGSMANMASINLGDESMISAITVIMVGATFIRSGVFNIPGTILASFLLQMLDNGLTMVGASAWMRSFIQGTILLASLVLVMVFKQHSSRPSLAPKQT